MKMGITGHQNFTPQAKKWVSHTLEILVKQYEVSLGYTCLAAGADQCFAKVLAKREIPFVAIIPSSDYDKTFSTNKALRSYQKLIVLAKKEIKLNFEHPTEKAFLKAGEMVVDCSDKLLAIWDGKPVKGLGGTADIVKYAVSQKKQVIHLNPINKHVVSL